MITLNSLSKIYRTDEIETVALENVNLTVDALPMPFHLSMMYAAVQPEVQC